MDNLSNSDMNSYRNNHSIHVNLNINHLHFDKYYQRTYFDIFQTKKLITHHMKTKQTK